MKLAMRTTIGRTRAPWIPDNGPAFLTDPRRGCSPEKLEDMGAELDLFYSENPVGRANAIRICRTACPFRRECDQYATDRKEKWGIWGGRSRDPRLVPIDDQRVYDLWRRHWTDVMIAERIQSNPRAVAISRRRQGLFAPGDLSAS